MNVPLRLPSGPISGTRAIDRTRQTFARLKYSDVLVRCVHWDPTGTPRLISVYHMSLASVGLEIGTCGGSGALGTSSGCTPCACQPGSCSCIAIPNSDEEYPSEPCGL
jgi:hypothetical protein